MGAEPWGSRSERQRAIAPNTSQVLASGESQRCNLLGEATDRSRAMPGVANRGRAGRPRTRPIRRPRSPLLSSPSAASRANARARSSVCRVSPARTAPDRLAPKVTYDWRVAPEVIVEVRERPQDWQRFAQRFHDIENNVEKVVRGKHAEIRLALVALVAEGHLLIEDVPGVGKTMLAKAIARSIDCSFRRLQFTPDMLPPTHRVNVFNQSSATSSSSPASSPPSCWAMRSTGHRPRPVGLSQCMGTTCHPSTPRPIAGHAYGDRTQNHRARVHDPLP